jgi:hypothetical protein
MAWLNDDFISEEITKIAKQTINFIYQKQWENAYKIWEKLQNTYDGSMDVHIVRVKPIYIEKEILEPDLKKN